ncbi:MAG: DUF1573 domain-containing protein, partial [Verrucomicrobiae bacterium]|nr:DUF1573 domain-containing protein [Verrucomicrobiae bacterium]
MDGWGKFKHLASKETVVGLLIGFLIVFTLFALLKKPEQYQQRMISNETSSTNAESQLIYFEPEYFEYGDVLQAQRIDFTFRLVNKSSNDVYIAAFHKVCPCTMTSNNVVGLTVPAGKELEIPVDYYTGSMSGRADLAIEAGLKWKNMYIIRRGLVKMNIIEDYYFEPRVVDFGILYPGQISVKKVVFVPKALTNFYLMSTQEWHGPFEVIIKGNTNRAKVNNYHEAEIVFHSPEAGKRETFDLSLFINTSSARVPRAKIPVRAQVVPNLEILPDTIVLTEGLLSEESLIT